ncbi:hypothetical protein [Kordia sp.]|uniref:hypothetical protein n=1 Tax=Kordia sp. TaxID=1965332 RepID=UPI003D6C4900
MELTYHNRIVKISDEIEIGQFNESNEYIITHQRLGNRIVVNQLTLDILNLIDNKSSLATIVDRFNEKATNTISVKTALALLYGKLGKQGIIIDENYEAQKKSKNSYLYLSFTLISKKNLNFFTNLVSPLISFTHFYKILFASLAVVLFSVIYNHSAIVTNFSSINVGHIIFFVFIKGGIIFLHEFGHAAACKKLGAEPGSVGFGFYLLSPVMYADVSDVWKLKSKERNYVNFAGLYMEVLLAVVLTAVYFFIIQDISLLIINHIILLSFVLNLNPFLRYDGYWVLSDTIKTANLRKVSMEKLRLCIQSIFKKGSFSYTTKNIFLVVYAFISAIFIFVFLGIIFLKDPNSLITFPVDFYTHIKTLIVGGKPFIMNELTQFILPFLFYFIIIKLFISKFIGRKHKRQRFQKTDK